MLRPKLEGPRVHLERARDHEGGSKLLGAPTMGGGSAQAGVGGGGSYISQICPHAERRKNGWFCILFGFKIAKNTVFHSKVLSKIYSQDVF
jgi:hypothetical protein